MTLTTTFRKLRKASACEERYKFLRAALKGVKDYEPINLLTILSTNGLNDALWALAATVEDCEKTARLMAADFAEDALQFWNAKYPDDDRPRAAIHAAREFAYDRITREQMLAARSAAESAVESAAESVAESAAWSAARSAAESAAKERQKEIFMRYLQPEAL